ncbi:MAG: MFS transporter [Bacteroidales bacterium]
MVEKNEEEKVTRKSPTLLAIMAAAGSLLFGYHLAQISGVVPGLSHYFIEPLDLKGNSSNLLLGFLVSAALLGSIPGSLFAGKFANRFGRKSSLLLVTILFFITSFISAWPQLGIHASEGKSIIGLLIFVISRLVSGFALGMVSAIVPLYISEISPVRKRGRLIGLSQMGIVVGILLAYIVNYGIESMGNQKFLIDVGWRYMLMAESILALILFFLFINLEESPHFIKQTEAVCDKPKERVSISFYGKLVVILSFCVFAFQPFCGMNVIFFYAPKIFAMSGASIHNSYMQTLFLGGINFIATIFALKWVDHIGRKKLYLLGALGMFVCISLLGVEIYTGYKGIFMLILVLLFIAIFALTWGPVTWIYASEVLPPKIRPQVISIGVAGQWVVNYLFTWMFPVLAGSKMLNELFNHAFPFWFYAIMILIPTLVVMFLGFETRNKTANEIEERWLKK